MIQPLGLFYILTLVVKPAVTSLENQMAEEVYQAVEACITSTQGFVISLPYCFLNGEVRSVVRNRWRRWRMVRSVGRESGTGTITSSTLVINQKGSLQIGCGGLRDKGGIKIFRSKVCGDWSCHSGVRVLTRL